MLPSLTRICLALRTKPAAANHESTHRRITFPSLVSIIKIPVENIAAQSNREPCRRIFECCQGFLRRVKVAVNHARKCLEVCGRVDQVTGLHIGNENGGLVTLPYFDAGIIWA